jgi:hypothetical protein
MATSGNTIVATTTQALIKDSFIYANIYNKVSAIPTDNYNTALDTLNDMIQGWKSIGFNIWKDKQAFLFTQYNTSSYSLGNTAHATESYVGTTLSVAVVSGAGSITVADATGISSGDFIGIIKDNNNIFWTTVNGAPVANVITLTANIDGDASSGKTVFAYTTKITKPFEITSVTLLQNSNNEVRFTQMSRERYMLLANKTSLGSPTQYYYQRRRLDTLFYIWTAPSDPSQPISFTYQPYFDKFLDANNEPDFPTEWFMAIKWNLSSELGIIFGINDVSQAKVDAKAEYWLKMALSNDNEDATLTFK